MYLTIPEIITITGTFNVTGALRVNARLDYERLTKRVLPVEVEAISQDGKKTAFARIRIQIQDINDNSPVFDLEVIAHCSLFKRSPTAGHTCILIYYSHFAF